MEPTVACSTDRDPRFAALSPVVVWLPHFNGAALVPLCLVLSPSGVSAVLMVRPLSWALSAASPLLSPSVTSRCFPAPIEPLAYLLPSHTSRVLPPLPLCVLDNQLITIVPPVPSPSLPSCAAGVLPLVNVPHTPSLPLPLCTIGVSPVAVIEPHTLHLSMHSAGASPLADELYASSPPSLTGRTGFCFLQLPRLHCFGLACATLLPLLLSLPLALVALRSMADVAPAMAIAALLLWAIDLWALLTSPSVPPVLPSMLSVSSPVPYLSIVFCVCPLFKRGHCTWSLDRRGWVEGCCALLTLRRMVPCPHTIRLRLSHMVPLTTIGEVAACCWFALTLLCLCAHRLLFGSSCFRCFGAPSLSRRYRCPSRFCCSLLPILFICLSLLRPVTAVSPGRVVVDVDVLWRPSFDWSYPFLLTTDAFLLLGDRRTSWTSFPVALVSDRWGYSVPPMGVRWATCLGALAICLRACHRMFVAITACPWLSLSLHSPVDWNGCPSHYPYWVSANRSHWSPSAALEVTADASPPESATPCVIHAMVARAPSITPNLGAEARASPIHTAPPNHAELATLYDGLKLHISLRSATGYEGVSLRRTRPTRPYRVKAPGGKLLGDFSDVLDAAACYARHMLSRPFVSPTGSTTVSVALPCGASAEVALSPQSPTGFLGVTRPTDQFRSKPYLARLGPRRTDYIGYFATAEEAAAAVTAACQARDSFPILLSDDGFDGDILGPSGGPHTSSSAD